MRTLEISTFLYQTAPPEIRLAIFHLLQKVWPDDLSATLEQIPAAHNPKLGAQSFCCWEEGKLVGYAAVLQTEIIKAGNPFFIGGLSCVCTDPDYQKRGIGKKVVQTATHWMRAQKNIDFGVFTCDPSLCAFYDEAGGWALYPDVCLIESHRPDALRSDKLGVAVMMQLFSQKAKASQSILSKGELCLDFPSGEFL